MLWSMAPAKLSLLATPIEAFLDFPEQPMCQMWYHK